MRKKDIGKAVLNANRKMFLCALVLLTGLCGCGRDSITPDNEFPAKEVSTLQITADNWNIHIMASSDSAIHVGFDGEGLDKASGPTAVLSEGTLFILQQSDDKEMEDQIALEKKGQITLLLPSSFRQSVTISNGYGDMEIEDITASSLQLENTAGYAVLSGLTTDSLTVSSASGDITVKNGTVAESAVTTASGYVSFDHVSFRDTKIVTKSGEVNLSKIEPDANVNVQTGSGDVSLSWQTAPEDLRFGITSGSKDVTVPWNGADYEKETASCKQGSIGSGQYLLEINSDSGTVAVR